VGVRLNSKKRLMKTERFIDYLMDKKTNLGESKLIKFKVLISKKLLDK